MTEIEETPTEKKKRLAARNKFRNTVCSGCRHNYYNFAKERSPRGDVAVSEDYSCWHIHSIRNGKCPCKS